MQEFPTYEKFLKQRYTMTSKNILTSTSAPGSGNTIDGGISLGTYL